MGSVFGFVGSEIGGKMEILEQLVNKDNHFQTMKEMVNYEMENGLLQHRSYISGSRTLLRLHRGLGEEIQTTQSVKHNSFSLVNLHAI